MFVYLLLLLLLLEHHLCIGDLSSERNQGGQHKRERKLEKLKMFFNKKQETEDEEKKKKNTDWPLSFIVIVVPIIIPLPSLCFIASIYILHFLFIICIPLKHVQEVFLGGCSEEKNICTAFHIGLKWTEISLNLSFIFYIIKKKRFLKRLVEVEI